MPQHELVIYLSIKEQPLSLKLNIPSSVAFHDLHLSFNEDASEFFFNSDPLVAICSASGLHHQGLEHDAPECIRLILHWYQAHLLAGGPRFEAAEVLEGQAQNKALLHH